MYVGHTAYTCIVTVIIVAQPALPATRKQLAWLAGVTSGACLGLTYLARTAVGVYESLKRYEEAIADYTERIRLAPTTSSNAVLHRGFCR